MRLLRRHLLRTLAGPFAFAWIAQTGMLMLNQLSRRFGDLVGRGLPPRVIAEVLLLFIPFIVALTLPMAILVAVLYGFSQMGADNELTAMRANGVSVLQMLRPVLAAGVLLSIANFLFIDQVLPRTNLRLLNLQTDIAQKKPTFSLKEQTINNLPQSQYFLLASTIEPVTGRMREVVIYDLSPAAGRRVIYADSGYMSFEHGERDLGIQLYVGRVNEYKSAEPATVNVTRFARNTIRVRNIQNAFQQSFGSVPRGDREMTTCEMMDRVAASRQDGARLAARRVLLAQNDARALLHLFAPPTPPAGELAPAPHCGGWRAVERRIGRWLLPKSAAAQVPAAAPPAVAVPGDTSVKLPTGAALSNISELSGARDEEAFALREVHQYSVEIHKKFALSVACMNFVLIGIALALRFPRGGVGLVIGGSLVIFALFYVGLTVGENLADRGAISPALAMWLPNGLVFLAGVLGLIRVNREFGSTRGGDLADLGDLLLGWLRRRRAA
ncbi:MAG TPA: LptF/LptG family permease [Gemmatimonadales bacterium]|nr:LptF/LptG family permease [Gemmatimonadales bacterium]